MFNITTAKRHLLALLGATLLLGALAGCAGDQPTSSGSIAPSGSSSGSIGH
ncbi:MAG TPA: hypothetical protein VG733_14445 [Chthoniobacteraceae bacterium]|nr:hypothetical protein [Chthoniobacteraceae bacterium]